MLFKNVAGKEYLFLCMEGQSKGLQKERRRIFCCLEQKICEFAKFYLYRVYAYLIPAASVAQD